MAQLLEVSGLKKSFGGVHAVAGVDFTVAPNSLEVIIGPNGAGKSTFFKLVTGQLRPTEGAIAFRGKSLVGLQPFEIARLGVGIKTQVPSVFEGLSVLENVWLAARRAGHDRRRATEVARRVISELHLETVSERLLNRLSHGERQRVEIASVIAPEPALILLDEPVAGLTDAEADDMAAMIRRLAEHHAIVVVEHDMRFVRLLGSRVTVFDRGALLTAGPVETVLEDPVVRRVYLGGEARAV